MPHNARHGTVAQRRDQPQGIPDQVEHAKGVEVTIVVAVPARGAPIAPLVGSNDMKPGRRKGQHHLSPAIGQFREAVEKQDAGAVLAFEASLQQVHGEAIDVGHEAGAYAVRQGERLESHRLPLSPWRCFPGMLPPSLGYATQVPLRSKPSGPAVLREKHIVQQHLGAMQINRMMEYFVGEFPQQLQWPASTYFNLQYHADDSITTVVYLSREGYLLPEIDRGTLL